jgi:hypothetical protein
MVGERDPRLKRLAELRSALAGDAA